MNRRKIFLVLFTINLNICFVEHTSKQEAQASESIKNQVTLKTKKVENNIHYITYVNSRFGFSVDYPEGFKVEENSHNGDGAEITDGIAIVKAFGSNKVLRYDVNEHFNISKDIERDIIIKEETKDNYYLIVIEKDGVLRYTKTVVGEGSINSISIEYPKIYTEKYSEISERILESLKVTNINNGR